MDRFSKYHSKKKEYRNAYKRLKYKLDTGKISLIEFTAEIKKLRIKYNIN